MTKNTKNKFALIFMLSITFGGGFLYGSAKTDSSNTALSATDKIAQPSENKDREIILLRAENEMLRKKMLSSSVVPTTQKSTQEKEISTFQETEKLHCEEKLKSLEKFASDVNSKMINKKIERIFSSPEGGSNWAASLEKEFANEKPDVQWANEEQEKYISLFAEDNELAGFALINAECKSEQCKITVAAKTLEDSNNISDRLANVLRKSNSQPTLMIAPDLQRNSTNLYVRRDGKGFEFN